MPAELEQKSIIRACEYDSVTGRLMAKLYPNVAVRVKGY